MTTDKKTSRIAIITGSGSGIGRACSLALLKDGWQVFLAGRTLSTLQETAQLAEEHTSNAHLVVTNIADHSSVKQLFQTVKEKFGQLNFLFNNAGQHAFNLPTDELSCEQWNSMVQTNLTGTFLCAQQAFVLMKNQTPQGGRIINNGSLSAHCPRPDSIAFTSTQYAIKGMTNSLALDGRNWNIACGQIDIGNTVMNLSSPPPPRSVKQADGSLLAESIMDVKQVADMILLMANMPTNTNPYQVILLPTKVPFIGRG